jgi:spermidine/putrescine transport system substrate-binding protein
MTRRLFLLTASSALTACTGRATPRLNVYNWSAYIDPEMVKRFERERGVRIRYGVYESNEEMLARILTGNSGWDIVFPTHSRLEPMARNGLLAELDHTRLSQINNLDQRFQQPEWDPRLQWGLPYMWNGTGIAWNKVHVNEPKSWSALWDPTLRGRITMLDDVEDGIGICLLKLGLSFHSADPVELQGARQVAIEQKRLLRAYINAEVRDQLVAGDVLAAQLWSTTTAQAMHAAPVAPIAFTYPGEGFPLYCDCAVILAESRRKELAHEFLDFLLTPDVAAGNARVGDTATACGPARNLLPPDPVQYPPDEIYRRGFWPHALPSVAQRYRDRLWTEIKSA